MLDFENLIAFYRAKGFPVGVTFAQNRVTSKPDELVTLTHIPGLPSSDVERAMEYVGVQVRVRADEKTPIRAEQLIAQLDRIMLDDSLFPARLGSHVAFSAGRQGGPPVYLTTDHQNRVSYVANYWLQITRLSV